MDKNNNIDSEIHEAKSIAQNEFLYGWIENNNLLLTEEDIRAVFLEGYEDIEGLSLQETSTIPFASSWMDATLSKTRARSRLWPPSKSTTTVSNFTTNDLNTTDDVDFKLDKYHETDLENDIIENSKSQETDHSQLTDFQNCHEFSKREKIDSGLQKSTTICSKNEEKSSTDSKIINQVNVKLYNEKSYLNTAYDKMMSLIGQLKHDTTGISHYLYFCALNRVSPLRYVVQNLGKEKLSLQHRGIGNLEIKLITEALRVSELNLQIIIIIITLHNCNGILGKHLYNMKVFYGSSKMTWCISVTVNFHIASIAMSRPSSQDAQMLKETGQNLVKNINDGILQTLSNNDINTIAVRQVSGYLDSVAQWITRRCLK
ncbi:unnamed protein product [Schistosoma mattheei]|uniref:Uncharacterized protein n=1 Tax=Schistosoma mattheei TaxID=31246 RepID=A0A183P852_9TREM|nr:unnamed protein product [Schistosoma mattheei]